MSRRVRWGVLPSLLALVALACQAPAQRFADRATALGFESHAMQGSAFRHVLFSRDVSPEVRRIHVYLGGDGSPARAARHDPLDPTPGRDPTLELMATDPRPRVFLGRPCHHEAGPCDPVHFTLGRYGEPVVASMVAALEQFGREQRLAPAVEWVLIGFSGGGTLAVLMAERLANTRAVVTLAANLDLDAWARDHDFEPLVSSLNPTARAPLPDTVLQIHLFAGRDTNVPPRFSRRFLDRQPNAIEIHHAGFDHTCCWQEAWPSTLHTLEVALAEGA